jgi:hypothetical protein
VLCKHIHSLPPKCRPTSPLTTTGAVAQSPLAGVNETGPTPVTREAKKSRSRAGSTTVPRNRKAITDTGSLLPRNTTNLSLRTTGAGRRRVRRSIASLRARNQTGIKSHRDLRSTPSQTLTIIDKLPRSRRPPGETVRTQGRIGARRRARRAAAVPRRRMSLSRVDRKISTFQSTASQSQSTRVPLLELRPLRLLYSH